MNNKKCFKCNAHKNINEFYKHPKMPDGHVNKCKECNKKDVRDRRKIAIKYYEEYDKYRYRNNINRLLKHKYKGMKDRTTKTTYGKRGSFGKSICTYDEFYEWANIKYNLNILNKLITGWKNSGYKNKNSPSIDRIDNSLGYSIDNLQWLDNKNNLEKYLKTIRKK